MGTEMEIGVTTDAKVELCAVASMAPQALPVSLASMLVCVKAGHVMVDLIAMCGRPLRLEERWSKSRIYLSYAERPPLRPKLNRDSRSMWDDLFVDPGRPLPLALTCPCSSAWLRALVFYLPKSPRLVLFI